MPKKQSVLYEKEYTIAVPVIEYVVIGHIAIHKKVFLFWTAFMFIAVQALFAWILGLDVISAFYGTILLVAWNFHLTHPLMFAFDAVAIGSILFIVWYSRHRYWQRHMKPHERSHLEQLRRQQNGGETYE